MTTYITKLGGTEADVFWGWWLVLEHPTKDAKTVVTELRGLRMDPYDLMTEEEADEDSRTLEKYMPIIRQVLEPLGYTRIEKAAYVFNASN